MGVANNARINGRIFNAVMSRVFGKLPSDSRREFLNVSIEVFSNLEKRGKTKVSSIRKIITGISEINPNNGKVFNTLSEM